MTDEIDSPLDAAPNGSATSATDGTGVPEASKHISFDERMKLWVRAGGRCAICNEYLLEDDFTRLPFNLGELAHNVGRKMSASSPRGLDPLPIPERNRAENLLLLCGAHHRLIDHRLLLGDYTVEDLRRMKAKHEERIYRLTAMAEDSETVVVRIIGDIRGAPVELDARSVRAAVVEHSGRYPHYGLAYRGNDLEVDLRGLPGEGSSLYWQMASRRLTIAWASNWRMRSPRTRSGTCPYSVSLASHCSYTPASAWMTKCRLSCTRSIVTARKAGRGTQKQRRPRSRLSPCGKAAIRRVGRCCCL